MGVSLFLDTAAKSCVEECSASFFADDRTSICLPCDDGETHCTSQGSGDAISCGKNSKGIQTFLNKAKDCVVAEQCDAAHFADKGELSR